MRKAKSVDSIMYKYSPLWELTSLPALSSRTHKSEKAACGLNVYISAQIRVYRQHHQPTWCKMRGGNLTKSGQRSGIPEPIGGGNRHQQQMYMWHNSSC